MLIKQPYKAHIFDSGSLWLSGQNISLITRDLSHPARVSSNPASTNETVWECFPVYLRKVGSVFHNTYFIMYLGFLFHQ
jgi:hypothetical protein